MASFRLTLLVLTALLSTACNARTSLPSHHVISFGGEDWTMELALDDDAIRRGLMNRDSVPEHGGMLFIFPDSDIRSFWMANCIVDIDLLFLDNRGTITALHEMKVEASREDDESELAYNARLKNYGSNFPARFAIEIPAGSIKRLQLRVNQQLPLDLVQLQSLRTTADRQRRSGVPPA